MFPSIGDSYYSNTTLLLPMEGQNNSTDFADISVKNKAVTNYGDAKISNALSMWGAGSGYFDGVGDYLVLPDSTDWAFGTNDFTIEGWFYFTGFATNHAYGSSLVDTRGTSQSMSGFTLFANSSGALTGFDANSAAHSSANSLVTTGNWYHIAASRKSGQQRIFLNGTSVVSYASSYNHTGQQLTIGTVVDYRDTSVNFKLAGYIQDLRITNAGRYDSDFTPPGRLSMSLKNVAWQVSIYYQTPILQIARQGL